MVTTHTPKLRAPGARFSSRLRQARDTMDVILPPPPTEEHSWKRTRVEQGSDTPGTSNQTCSDGGGDAGKGKLHPDLNLMFTKQINQELFAFYTYLSMATYFGRNSVALPGCQRFFLRMSDEEKDHAQCLIDYQNMRGSVVEFCTITVPEPKEWQTPEEALKAALELEESVRQNLEALCQSGAKFNDASLCDFISGKFIQEQVRSQNEIRALLATAARLGNTGIGIHLFDMMLRSDKLPFDKPSVF